MVCETATITLLKYIWYCLAVVVFEYLQISTIQFSILWLLMIIDFMAGISKQWVLNPVDITSHRAWLWILKKAWTLISVIVVAMMLSAVWPWDSEKYVIAMVSLLIMAETYSILQNIYVIRTGEKITEYDVVSKVIKWVWEVISDTIEKTLKK